MNMILAVLCLSLAAHLIITLKSPKDDKYFSTILLICHIYFCFGSYFYWVYYAGAYFVGMNWDPNSLSFSILLLSASTTCVSGFVYLTSILAPLDPVQRKWQSKTKLFPGFVFLTIGFLAAIFVAAFGIGNEFEVRNPFLLIAYQFADILIPTIVYFNAARPGRLINRLLVGVFTVYAVFVGFRYKLALLFIPLFIMKIVSPGRTDRKIIELGFYGVGATILFSAMTIYRTKFGTPELDRQIVDPISEVLLSFFAESNIVFGLNVVISKYFSTDAQHTLAPIYDSFLELIPKVLIPERTSGRYLEEMKAGFQTEEGANSGTAYPFVGEFIIMLGGFGGLVAAVFVYGGVFSILRRFVRSISPNGSILSGGLGLLAALMGYYHYSRGYLPQAVKAYIFIFFPYVVLAWLSNKKLLR